MPCIPRMYIALLFQDPYVHYSFDLATRPKFVNVVDF